MATSNSLSEGGGKAPSVAWFVLADEALKTNFCRECGGLLPLPNSTGVIKCSVCGFRCTTEDLMSKEIVSRSKLYQDKAERAREKTNSAAVVRDGSVLCPQCDHHELSFKTAQLRSADEGQTIFYECTKCEFTWSVNT